MISACAVCFCISFARLTQDTNKIAVATIRSHDSTRIRRLSLKFKFLIVALSCSQLLRHFCLYLFQVGCDGFRSQQLIKCPHDKQTAGCAIWGIGLCCLHQILQPFDNGVYKFCLCHTHSLQQRPKCFYILFAGINRPLRIVSVKRIILSSHLLAHSRQVVRLFQILLPIADTPSGCRWLVSVSRL